MQVVGHPNFGPASARPVVRGPLKVSALLRGFGFGRPDKEAEAAKDEQYRLQQEILASRKTGAWQKVPGGKDARRFGRPELCSVCPCSASDFASATFLEC